MSDRTGRSVSGQVQDQRRPDVLIVSLEAALRETPLVLEDFGLALAEQYHERVPDQARTIAMERPALSMTPHDYARAVGRLIKRVQRYLDGSGHVPCELEEAWAYALPEPYGEHARHELVWRYGFTGAMSYQGDPCPDTQIMGRLLSETGRTTTVLARALVNGRFDPDDIRDGEIESSLRELESAVGSIRARVQRVRDRLDYPEGVDRFAERRRRVRAAKASRDD